MHHDFDWPDPDPGHGPVWHAVMSLLTIAGIAAIACLAVLALRGPA